MFERRIDLPGRGVSPDEGGAPRSRSGLSARYRRPACILGGLLAAVGLWRFITADDPPPEIPVEHPVGIEVDNLKSMLVRRDGKRLWEISASHIRMAADGTQTVATGMHRGILYQDDKPFLIVSAPKVTLQNRSNDLIASGGLQVQGPDQLRLNTGRAQWVQAKQLLTCPKPVQGRMKSLNFAFPQLKYQVDKGTLSAPGPVEVSGQGLRLRGQNVRANIKSRVVEMTGGTELVFDPNRLPVVQKPASLPIH